jgi:GT2 family glycosyltransferase
MIGFGVSITKPDVYERCAGAGIELAKEPDSAVLAYNATGSIFRSYNLLLDKAAELDDLEAFVLVHQDAEIVDPHFCGKLREALRDPEVGVVGCVGAIGVRSIAWWEGSVTWASFSHRYTELGGGEVESFSWNKDALPPYARIGEVDTLDGFVLALSPWAVRNLRFDEAFTGFHGYDVDYCLSARAAGRTVLAADLGVVHHTKGGYGDGEAWDACDLQLQRKWSLPSAATASLR